MLRDLPHAAEKNEEICPKGCGMERFPPKKVRNHWKRLEIFRGGGIILVYVSRLLYTPDGHSGKYDFGKGCSIMKRFLASLLALIMVIGMLPTTALASEGEQPAELPAYVVLPEGVNASNYEDMFGTNTVTDGTNYYATLPAALAVVCGTPNAVLYCKPGANVGQMTHGEVKASLTVYGNGAYTSGNGDFAFDGANTGNFPAADMTLTVKNLDGCGAWGYKNTNVTINIVFENCKDMSEVYITTNGNTKPTPEGTTNITMTDCEFTDNVDGGNCKVYSTANGTVTLTRVLFSGVDKAVNLNHKMAGTQTVVLNNCTFTNCGDVVASDEIPVRVLSSVAGGKSVLTVSNCTFSGTPEGGVDILLDYGVGETTATVSGTCAMVGVEMTDGNSYTSVSENETLSFCNIDYVAQIGETKYATLPAAIAAAEGDTITLLDNVTLNNETVTIPAGKTVILDLNGYAVKGYFTQAATTAVIANKGTLTIVDNSENGNGLIELVEASPDPTYGYGTNTVRNDGMLTIKSGTIRNNYGGASYTVDTNVGGTTIIEGGLVENTRGTGARVYSWSTDVASTLKVTGGTVRGGAAGILVQDLDYDGTENDKLNNMLKLSITGGTIEATGTDGYALNVYALTEGVSVSGGTFNGHTFDYGLYYGVIKGYITGGTYNSYWYVADTEYFKSAAVADDYKVVQKAESEYVVLPAASYLVTFDPNGGAFAEIGATPITDVYTADDSMPRASREGYTFNGWFTSAEGGEKVTAISKDGILYAQWIVNTPVYYPPVVTPTPEPEAPTVDTSAPVVDSTTTENEDGSTTKTETLENGATVETTTNTDGSKTETATKSETVETEQSKTTTTTTVTTNTSASGETVKESTEEVKVENADGSAATTTTTVTETATKTEKTEVREEVTVKEDGTTETKTTSTTETAHADGSTGTTTVDETGKVEAEVTVSAAAVSEAAKADETVALPMPAVTATTETETAPVVAVALPAAAGSVAVEIPVENASAGTVVVIVNEDGTEKVVKSTELTENGVAVTLEGDATIKVVDNSIDFTDVPENSTFSDAIDYMSSRELMNGRTETTFNGNDTTTRAMVWTIIGRGADQDLYGSGVYAKAADWATSTGVSDGSNPDSSVTRQQLAVMLWRQAGMPHSDHDISGFNDGDNVSDYAAVAMAWAVENGILNGNNGNLNPKGNATRNHVAAMYMRYVQAMNEQ